MERQMRHLVRLVDDLLDVSRITRDRLELRPEPVEMSRIVANARETVQPMLDAAGQALVVDVPEQPLLLFADPHRLSQVLGNLLSNASKFSEPGSAITLRVGVVGDQVEVAVRDQGIGIAPEKMREIFEMFTQADASLEKAREVHKLNQSLTATNIDLARSNRNLQIEILERRNVEDRLRQADRRKDEFLATLAHELRNPLAPIQSALNVRRLGSQGQDDELQEVMERQMRHLVRLVDDLLDVSRITRDRLELRPEAVELASVVAVARETVQPLLDASGQALRVDIPAEPIVLFADPHRLSQLLANLLSNASKFSEAGAPIHMQVKQDGDSIEVVVRDQGIGVAPDKLREIFEMFAQADSSLERARGGLGIGLSLARRLAEMHGGQLSARSDGPGKGSEFTVRLPVSSVQDVGPVQVVEKPATDHAAGAPLRVLVVDDNRDSADMLALSLKLMGHEVVTLYDPLEVLAAARAWRPQLAFLDVGMPVLNGFSLAEMLRAEPWPDGQGPRLVALTGWGQEEDRRRSEEAGFDEHLVKPADLETIERVCQDAAEILGTTQAAAH
jgi:signal transduction histidine kinase/ActR/RegA family two-component response regulator